MTDKAPPADDKRAPSRDERLAQRLRENLRRRKAQARALGAVGENDEPSQA